STTKTNNNEFLRTISNPDLITFRAYAIFKQNDNLIVKYSEYNFVEEQVVYEVNILDENENLIERILLEEDQSLDAYELDVEEGYTFDGFYYDSQFTSSYNFNDINKHLTIYAKLVEDNLTPIKASDLFISMYVEGAPGNRKVIQIYNGTGEAVDLSNYLIKVASNGGTWAGSGGAQLTGILQNNSLYTVRYGADGNWDADLSSASLSFNGDDAIGLFKNNILIDIFGIQAEDPGTGWSLSGTGNGSD